MGADGDAVAEAVSHVVNDALGLGGRKRWRLQFVAASEGQPGVVQVGQFAADAFRGVWASIPAKVLARIVDGVPLDAELATQGQIVILAEEFAPVARVGLGLLEFPRRLKENRLLCFHAPFFHAGRGNRRLRPVSHARPAQAGDQDEESQRAGEERRHSPPRHFSQSRQLCCGR